MYAEKNFKSKKEFKEAVPAIAPFAGMAVPHIIDPELDVPIIRGAFGELS